MKRCKHFFVFLLAALLLMSCALPASYATDPADAEAFSSKKAKLLVNGNEIETDHAVIYSNDEGEAVCFDLPLIATLKALGGSVIWVCESRAIIFYKGFVLQLDTKRESVYFLSPEQNYFELVGGAGPIVRTRRQEGHDYIIDDSAAQSLFTLLEVKMICDVEDAIIRIDAEGRAPGLSFLLNAMVVIFGLPFLALNPFRFH